MEQGLEAMEAVAEHTLYIVAGIRKELEEEKEANKKANKIKGRHC